MAEALGRCMICGDYVFPQMWACSSCAREHGLDGPYRRWPAWAKQLANDHNAARRDERARLGHEITTSELGSLPDFDPDPRAGGDDDRYPSERGNRAIDAAWREIASWRTQ